MLPDFELCCSEFMKYGLKLDKSKYEKLDIYADFLVEYNNNVNLTALTAPRDVLIKHFLDSVVVLNYVDFSDNSAIIDIGTGAGFPSVPLKIFRPALKITLLDSLDKRITFLRMLCEKLEIEAELIHGRAEMISKMPDYREKFDFSCARAVANLSVLSEYCLPFVRVGGSFISLKGPNEELEPAKRAISLLGGDIHKVSDYEIDGEDRRLIEVKKISQTPSKYPRNCAQIKKNSL